MASSSARSRRQRNPAGLHVCHADDIFDHILQAVRLPRGDRQQFRVVRMSGVMPEDSMSNEARMEVSGVFNSCDTMLSRSDFIRSATARSAAILLQRVRQAFQFIAAVQRDARIEVAFPDGARAVRQQAHLACDGIRRVERPEDGGAEHQCRK